jgi:flagellar hook-basal body complex protein FliE
MIHAVSLLSSLVSAPSLPLARSSATTESAATGAGGDFLSVLGGLAAQTGDVLRTAETASIKGLQGEMPVQQVVSSLMNAERSLQTMLAVRDKAVGAFQEISRMAI